MCLNLSTQMYQAGVRNLNLTFVVKEIAWPVILVLSLCIAIPYVIFMGVFPLLGMWLTVIYWGFTVIYWMVYCDILVVYCDLLCDLLCHSPNDIVVDQQFMNCHVRRRGLLACTCIVKYVYRKFLIWF